MYYGIVFLFSKNLLYCHVFRFIATMDVCITNGGSQHQTTQCPYKWMLNTRWSSKYLQMKYELIVNVKQCTQSLQVYNKITTL